MLRYLLILAFVLPMACRSSDKKEEPSSNNVLKQMGAVDVSAKPSANKPKSSAECASRPEPKACCEALTPSCNDCRDDNDKAQKDWESTCLSAEALPPKCEKPPPVSDCCPDYTSECEECRQQAAATLLAWKKACGTYEAHTCEAQPPTSMCCQAMIPSCQQCKDRNRRIREEWNDRCQKSEKAD